MASTKLETKTNEPTEAKATEPTNEPTKTFDDWCRASNEPIWLLVSAKFCNGWRPNSLLTKSEFETGIIKAKEAKLWQ